MKVIYLFFITVSFLSANNKSVYLENYWKKLLHVENGKSSIVSEEFFLSERYNFSLKNELDTTINLLQGEHGNEIACNFPARYLWIKKHFNIPNYKLDSCNELNQFLSTLQRDSLYLVYSSEYPNSPSSSFGHAMIAFKNNSTPLELSSVIHFAAKTDKDGFFTYGYKGLTGEYEAYFMRTSLFKKIYDYNIKEQRYIYAYRLDFNLEEIEKIQYHLYELRKATFKYYFLNQNCASQIVDLLELSNENKIIKKDKFHLPIDTIKIYQKRVKEVIKFMPLISKINHLMNKMREKEREAFSHVIKNNIAPPKNLSDLTKEALVYYYQFLFRKYHQSYSNYDEIMTLTYQKSNIDDYAEEPLKGSQPSKIGIQYDGSLQLNYMPLFVTYKDIQKDPMQEIEFKLLNIDLSLNNNDVEIENIDLLEVKSLPLQNDFYHPISWSFYLGLNRENFSNELKFQNSYGVGVTKNIGSVLSTTLLLNVGFDVSKSEFSGYINPSLLASSYLTDDIKVGIESQYKYYFTEKYYKNELFLTKKIDHYNVSVGYVKEKFDEKYTVGINYNY